MDTSRGENVEDGGGRMHEEDSAARTPSNNCASITETGKITSICVYIQSWNEKHKDFTIELGLKITSIRGHILPGSRLYKLPGLFLVRKEYFTIEVGLKITMMENYYLS